MDQAKKIDEKAEAVKKPAPPAAKPEQKKPEQAAAAADSPADKQKAKLVKKAHDVKNMPEGRAKEEAKKEVMDQAKKIDEKAEAVKKPAPPAAKPEQKKPEQAATAADS